MNNYDKKLCSMCGVNEAMIFSDLCEECDQEEFNNNMMRMLIMWP
jgi:hypothetical protein